MTSPFRQTTPDDVAGTVLRRAEVAKMARKLQDRLALASYKTQHGQESLSFNDVEAQLEMTVQRKRPSSSVGTASSSSSASFEYSFSSRRLASSPLTAPFSSDDLGNSGFKSSLKRNVHQSASAGLVSKPSKRSRSQSMAPPTYESSLTSWKSLHQLPQSSPGYHHKQGSRFSSSRGLSSSFASEAPTIPASPPFGHISDEDGDDMLRYSLSTNSAFRASPPRTPPPTRSRAARQRKAGGEEGADLLLYLATSPSPANPAIKSSRIFAPSTPPSNTQALPSSMLSTPGITGFSTPGQNFNFADFVNVTPSPAQGAFGNRTPGPAKTPLAAREARKRLNFDALIPHSGSTILSNIGRGSASKDSGLGMELGGELVS